MKTSSSIIQSISKQPQFRLLSRHICYNKFLALLPPRFRTLIAYISIKENRLFIAITHPGAKMELNYNKDLFKSLLAILNDKDSLCSFPKIEQITTYIPKFTEKATLNTEDTVPRYDEKSTANFDITTTDAKLKKAYDDIKKAILCNIQ